MKRFIYSTCLLIIVSNFGFAQSSFVFGVKPGLKINTAYVGISQGNFLPFMGIDMLWVSAEVSYEDADENFPTNDSRMLTITTLDYNANAFLLVPHLGLKFSLNSQAVRPYVFSSVFISFPLVNLEAEGTEESWEYQNGALINHEKKNVVQYVDEIEETANEALSFWGINFGAGAEYFFNPGFSVSGEYGIRIVVDSAKYEEKNKNYYSGDYPSNKFENEWRTKVAASLKLSYAVVGLNFYF